MYDVHPIEKVGQGRTLPTIPTNNKIPQDITESQEKLSDRDIAYMSAVESGDMETTQRMVEEAAKKAGYTVKAYHGTSYGGFTVFDTYGGKFGLFGKGSYFTDDKNVADSYQQKSKTCFRGKGEVGIA